jgi:hypothetical protein
MNETVARRLDALRDKGAMSDSVVANLVGTGPETVSRWKHGQAHPRASVEKTLVELEHIVDELADFYEPDQIRRWMFAPQSLLHGASPAELIQAERIDEVTRLLRQMRGAAHS